MDSLGAVRVPDTSDDDGPCQRPAVVEGKGHGLPKGNQRKGNVRPWMQRLLGCWAAINVTRETN
jgi:hypothetical protein